MEKRIVPGSSSTPINVHEYETFAKEYLPKSVYDYYASGSNDMQTLKENRNAFSRLRILPKVLRDISTISTSCTLLGQHVSFPVGISPTAMQKMAHPEGEEGTARASMKANTCMILSSLASTSIEDVATCSRDGLRWFQLYIYKDREITRELVQRAERAGYKAIVLTVDTPVLGQRESDVRNQFRLPSHLDLANFSNVGGEHQFGVRKSNQESGLSEYTRSLFDASITWKDVAWLRSFTKLPIIAKGIMSPEDAKIAVQVGCSAVLVSNHGARQLDGVPSTIEVLPEIVQAVQGQIEVYLDGGVRRGTDIFKALAFGAKAVFIGRPILWGLAHDGGDGAYRVLELLREELRQCLMFSGCANVQNISRDYLRHESYFQSAKL